MPRNQASDKILKCVRYKYCFNEFGTQINEIY